MKSASNKYFIAIIPPPPIFEQAQSLKLYFEERYNSKAALRSPPHITLHMPFHWKSEDEGELIAQLRRMSSELQPAAVTLKNFGCFKPRVIFIHVEPSENLAALQNQVKRFCRQELGLMNADPHDLPFHPHLTLAFRDLKKTAFQEAWKEFEARKFDGLFRVEKTALLKHDGKQWNVLLEFSLGKNQG